jgi:hypothetical protein
MLIIKIINLFKKKITTFTCLHVLRKSHSCYYYHYHY